MTIKFNLFICISFNPVILLPNARLNLKVKCSCFLDVQIAMHKQNTQVFKIVNVLNKVENNLKLSETRCISLCRFSELLKIFV